MFDTHVLRGSAIDLDISDVWEIAVSQARTSMTTGRWCDKSAREHTERGNSPSAYYARVAGEDSRKQAYQTMRPFRLSFESRTRLEREQAMTSVLSGAAQTVVLAADGSTHCDICGVQWGTHLVITGALVCPFGREYWTHAWALAATCRCGHDGLHAAALREIAQATRKHGAKRWPK